MACTQILSLIAALADANRRSSAAKNLAQRLGADDLIVFIKDTEVGALLPAPGFPQTFPEGRVWREFLSQCAVSGSHSGELVLPNAHTKIMPWVWRRTTGQYWSSSAGDPARMRLPRFACCFR